MPLQQQFEQLKGKLLVRAPAKINLSLLIAGKRPDGFHEIETVMSKVSLYDDLLFEMSDAPGVSLKCCGEYEVAGDEDNLVYRACMLAVSGSSSKSERLTERGIKITLTKRIPVGAGLGGGSSDAAAALMGLNKFASLGLNDDDLYNLAVQLGSDVPFFLGGPLAFCTGRGEKIRPIKQNFNFRVLLIFPDVTALTKRVYSFYKHDVGIYTDLSVKISDYLLENRVDFVTDMCVNMLEYACYKGYSELGQIKTRIDKLGISGVCLSGSGSTMYILDTGKGEHKVEDYQTMLKECIGCEAIIVDNNRW